MGCFYILGVESQESKFVIITKNSEDELKFDENNLSKYDVESNRAGLLYKFKNESKCVGLKYDDTPIWTYDSQINGEKYPLEISLNSYSRSVRVKTENRLYIYSYRNEKWDLIFETEVERDFLDDAEVVTRPDECLNLDCKNKYYSEGYCDIKNESTPNNSLEEFVNKLTENGIEIITVDGNYRTKINDIGLFCIDKKIGSTIYKLRTNEICCEIKYKGEVLWRDKYSRNGVDYPRVIYIYTDKEVICLDLSCQYFWMYPRLRGYLIQYEKWTPESEALKSLLLIKKLFHWPDQKSKTFNLIVEYEEGSVSYSTRNLEIVINYKSVSRQKFKKGEKCIEITSDNVTIWKHNPDKDGENYPTEVYVDFWEKRIIKIKLLNRSYLYSQVDKWVFEALYINQISENRMVSSLNKLVEDSSTDIANKGGDYASLIESTVYP